jgi:hypothetical protein
MEALQFCKTIVYIWLIFEYKVKPFHFIKYSVTCKIKTNVFRHKISMIKLVAWILERYFWRRFDVYFVNI